MLSAIRALRTYASFYISSRVHSERGATAVEYGLMVALIAVFIIGAVAALGGALDGIFNAAAEEIEGATP